MSITDSSTAVTANSTGIVVTADSTANVMGAWVEMIASTSEETFWVTVSFSSVGNDIGHRINFGLGAASSEVIKLERIPFYANIGGTLQITFPLTIPSGSRVSMQIQSSTGSSTLQCGVHLSNDSSFGTSTSNEILDAVTFTRATDIDPGGTDNVKGSYFELDASAGIDSTFLILVLQNSQNNAQTAQRYLVDVAIGAVSSEVDIIENLIFSSNGAELPTRVASFYQPISSGDRVSMRCQSSNSAAAGSNDRLMDAAIFAFKLDAPAGGGGGIAHIVGQGGIIG